MCICLSIIGVTAGTIASGVMVPPGWDLAVLLIIPVEILFGAVLAIGIHAAFQAKRFRDGYLDIMSYMAAAGIVVIEIAVAAVCIGIAAIGINALGRGRRGVLRGGSYGRMSSGHRKVFHIADRQRAISEDMQQWMTTTPNMGITDHFDWFDAFCAQSDGYID